MSDTIKLSRTDTYKHSIAGLLPARADLFREAERIRDRLRLPSATVCSSRTHASPHHRHRLHDRRIIVAFACPIHARVHGPFPQRAFSRRLQHLRAGLA